MTGIFEDHLGLDAIVAYVDGELALTAFQRAAAHVMHCTVCATEVADQSVAQQALRHALPPQMPTSLFLSLNAIPLAPPASRPVAGFAVDPVTGRVTREVSAEPCSSPHTSGPAVPAAAAVDAGRARRFRMGAGALVAGLAMGAVVVAATADPPVQPGPTLGPDTVLTGTLPVGGRTILGVHVVSRR